jgi:hypothetical protein
MTSVGVIGHSHAGRFIIYCAIHCTSARFGIKAPAMRDSTLPLLNRNLWERVQKQLNAGKRRRPRTDTV